MKMIKMRKGVLTGIILSVVLLALPAVTATETLSIFGNANEDATIDMQDVTFTERIILGLNASTDLADANYDGKINMQDVTQLELIILGRESKLTIIDSADRIVTVNKPVKRVVVLCPDEYQALRVLGADDKVVGITVEVGRDWDWLIGEEKPLVGKRYGPDPEAVLALEPDVVIGEEYTITKKLEGMIPDDIPMVVLSFAATQIIDEELSKLGYICEKEETVGDYLSNFRGKYVNLIKARTEDLPDEERPKMYVGWKPPDPYHVYFGGGAGAIRYSIDVAGGTNIFEDLPRWGGDVDPEGLINRTPDMAFYGIKHPTGGYMVDDPSNAKAMRDEIMNRVELANVTMVKNGSVYMVDTRTFLYGPSHPIGISYLAKILHPDLFEDLDPKEIFREYLRDWLKTDYDLDEHGVFIYHPEEYPDGK